MFSGAAQPRMIMAMWLAFVGGIRETARYA